MKNHFFTLVLLFVSFCTVAQETETVQNEDYMHYSLGLATMGEGGGIYFQMESELTKIENSSLFFKINAFNYYMTYVNNTVKKDITGETFGLAFGSRTYTSKTKNLRGFYYAGGIKYQQTKFKDNLYSGRYSYLSFLTPEIGYKFGIGKQKRFSIELNTGVEWVIEIAGGGDVDNKDFDNWKWGLGLSVGYSF